MRRKGTWMGRVIWESMHVAMVRSVIVLVVFLTALAAIESDWKLSSNHLGNGGPWNVQKTDKNTAEHLWIHCRKEFQEISEDGPCLDFHFPPPSKENHSFIKFYNTFLAKRSLREVISYLLFQEKHIRLDRTREENPPLHDLLNGNAFGTQFIMYKEFISGWSRVPRRSLRYKKYKHMDIQSAPIHSTAPSPGPAAVSPISAPGPSHQAPASSHSPVPSPSQDLIPPTQSPKQKPHDKSPSSLPTVHAPPLEPPSTPPELPNPPPKPPSAHRKPKKDASSSSENNEDSAYVIVAIAGCTMAAFAFVTLFLICCLKKSDENVGQRDEKPLLDIGSSDISAGSSQNSQSIENPGNKDSQTFSTVNNLSVATEIHSSPGTKNMATEATGAAPANFQTALPLPPGKFAPPPPGPSPPPPPKPPAPKAPPPPKARPPSNPPKPGNAPKSSPLGLHHRGHSSGSEGTETGGSPKTKLKPFFWDKVNASPDHSMVWHEIKAGSFQFNEEMMDSLFGYSPADQNKNERKKDSSSKSTPQYIQIIDAKKAQNLAILLKALNVTTEEVCDALKEGNELPPDLIETLLKMAPSADEELKLRLFAGDISQLGPADRFLKILIEIPFAFKRMELLLFMNSLQEEVSSIKESFANLEVACNELKNSRLFLKLLEAVLKTGNRMNNGTYRGGAQAFKLDTLLKLSDVKGTDGKTTLLHFVVQEIVRSEGIRAARGLRESHSMSSVKTEDLTEDVPQDSGEYHRNLGLQVVSGLSNELKNVKKAAVIDGDNLTQSVAKLGQSLVKAKDFLNTDMMSLEEDSEFRETLANFLEHAEGEIPRLLKEEQRIMALVKSTGDYFHGNSGKDEGLLLFVIVRDFLIMLDKVCKQVEKSAKSPVKAPRKETSTSSPSPQESQTESLPDIRQQLFPAITARKIDDDFSSDDESSTP